MQKKIFIRVDGSQQVGLGHLIRCIALGQMLQGDFDIHFVSKEIPASICGEIEKAGFKFTRIEVEHSFYEMLAANQIVVLDNYFFDTAYQKKIKELGCQLVCVDDLHDKEFYADLVINQVPGTRPSDYNAQVYTQFALGPDYALLRTPFLEQARKHRKINKIESVLICFGGADIKNLTSQTLELILQERRFKKVIVITGAAFNYLNELHVLIKNYSRAQHFHAVDQNKMLEIMTLSDLAIVPASGILSEALAAGCKVISGMYVDNQKYMFEEYKKAGYFESAEDFSSEHLKYAIDRIFESNLLNDKIIDGYSNERLLKCFKKLVLERDVKIRKAEETDVQKTFEWASDTRIRAFSFNKKAIEYEEHFTWFLNKVKSDSCYYCIAEIKGEAIGSIRYDINGKEAVISYLLDPNFQKMGLGFVLLKKGADYLKEKKTKDIEAMVGFVMPENIASIKAFERLGYSKQIEGNNLKFTKSLK